MGSDNETGEGPDLDNLKLIHGEIAERLKRQFDSSAKIDTKAAVIAGLAATAAQFLALRRPDPLLGTIAFTWYGVSFILAVAAIAFARHQDVPSPRELVDGYVHRSERDTTLALIATRVRAFERNRQIHDRKTRLWWFSIGALVLGIALSVTAILQTDTHDRKPRSGPSARPSAGAHAASGDLPAKRG